MKILLAIILSTIISNPALPVITGPSVQTELYQIQHFKNQIIRHAKLEPKVNQITFQELTPNPELMSRFKSQDGNFAGFFQIPAVNISVPIYLVHCYWDNYYSIAQGYVDKQNSAALMAEWLVYSDCLLIGDHVNQEFARLNEVTSGATATIYWNDNTYTDLHCIDAGPGNNNGLYLTDQYGNDWNYWTCDFAVYTCISGSASGVYITKWNYG